MQLQCFKAIDLCQSMLAEDLTLRVQMASHWKSTSRWRKCSPPYPPLNSKKKEMAMLAGFFSSPKFQVHLRKCLLTVPVMHSSGTCPCFSLAREYAPTETLLASGVTNAHWDRADTQYCSRELRVWGQFMSEAKIRQ